MDACRLLENEGISMITIHGRTRSQQYSGTANWDIIDECARAMSVPVIGNGDISTPQAVAYVKENTAVSGVMIGRAAMENPWISETPSIICCTESCRRPETRRKRRP